MIAPRVPSLRRNVLYSTFANGFFALTQWGIVIVSAHLGTAADVGVITVVTALVTPIFMFAQMAMRDGHSVDDLNEFTRADYIALRIVTSTVAVGVVAVVVFIYLAPAGAVMQATAASFAAVKLMGAQANMNHGIFQRAERLDYVALSLISRGFFGLISFSVCYLSTGNLALAFLAQGLIWWVCLYAVDLHFLNRLQARVTFHDVLNVSPRQVIKLAGWMLPLGLAVFLMVASTSVPKLVLGRNADLTVVGIFGAIAYINVALDTISGAIGTASAARLRRLYRDGQRNRFLRMNIRLALLSASLGGAMWLAALLYGGQILKLLYGDEYARGDIFQVAILAAALRVSAAPLQFAMNAGQAFWRRMGNSGFTFVVSLVSSVALIPSHGAVGAAWAMVIPAAVNLALTAFSTVRIVKDMPSLRP